MKDIPPGPYTLFSGSCCSTGTGDFFQEAGLSKLAFASRSEERRVGKECRSRWSPYH